MTKPTEAQIQRACDLANVAASEWSAWELGDYSQIGVFTALADTIAKLDAMQASRDAANARASEAMDRLDKARADLGEIYIQLDGVSGLHRLADDSRQAIEAAHDTAAPYRVETDPLVAEIGRLAAKHSVELSCEDVRSIAAYFKPIGRSA